MPRRLLSLFFAAAVAAAFLFGACDKKTATSAETEKAKPAPVTIEVVKETERSQHFTAVSRQLELGGTLYGYVDVDGDMLKLMGSLQKVLAELAKTQPQIAPFAQKDLAGLATTLGLTDVKAVGISSVADSTGYFRNRTFLYTGGQRHGLMAGLGGKPGPFTHINLAPADTAFYAESEIDLPVVYRAIKDVIAQVAGEPASTQLDAAINKAGERATISFLNLIYGLKGHSSLVLRVDGAKPIRIPSPSPLTIPGISFLISVDGVAPVIEPSLANTPLKRSDVGNLHVYEFPVALPMGGLQPAVIVEGNTLHIATSMAFFRECHDPHTGLAQDAAFQSALAAVGPEGNGLFYVSPKFFTEVRKLESLNPNLPVESRAVVKAIADNLPQGTRPLISVRSNLPDGILVRSYWDRSLKQEIALISANPVGIGLLAAMAIPAFQKVRAASQEKAVMNNLRVLAAAADQYYLENNVRTATYDQLVGPTHYVKVINSVAGENYRGLRFIEGQPLRVRLSDGRIIQYPPAVPDLPPGAGAPRKN